MKPSAMRTEAVPVSGRDTFLPVELVNARELAKLLSVSERTLYRLKSAGELPAAVVLGGSVRWRLSEIRQWIDEGCPVPTRLK
tara:strand:+ start:5673 stop:5921 length:249 start_codon:yes stop_codon:yes gene_type:complete